MQKFRRDINARLTRYPFILLNLFLGNISLVFVPTNAASAEIVTVYASLIIMEVSLLLPWTRFPIFQQGLIWWICWPSTRPCSRQSKYPHHQFYATRIIKPMNIDIGWDKKCWSGRKRKEIFERQEVSYPKTRNSCWRRQCKKDWMDDFVFVFSGSVKGAHALFI